MKIIEPKVELWQRIFNNYLCYGLLCNIVVLKVVKDEEMRNNK